MANLPGPFQVRIFYTTTASAFTRTHIMALNCDLVSDPGPGLPFTDYDVVTRAGGSVQLDVAIDAFIQLLEDCLHTSATIDYAELWAYAPGTSDAAFYSVYPIAEAGDSAGGAVADGEVIITFRTIGGGSMRLHILEGFHNIGTPDSPPFAQAPYEAVAAFIVSTSNWILARDDTYPFAAIALYPGLNEKLFKDRLR